MGSSAQGGFVGGRPQQGAAGPPQMGTIASSQLPNPGGIGSTAKGAAPMNYFKNAADLPKQGGFMRPAALPGKEQGIGLNWTMPSAPAPAPPQQNDMRRNWLAMALNASAPGHFGGLMGRHPSRRTGSGSDRGGYGSSGGRGGGYR